MSAPKKTILLPLIVWGAIIVAIRLLANIKSVPLIANNSVTLTAVLLLYVPLVIAIVKKQRLLFWDFSGPVLKKALATFVLVSLIIFPAAFVINHFYQTLLLGTSYHPVFPSQRPPISAAWILIQVVLIALPEEFFFRGYLTEAFEKIWPSNKKVFGAPFGVSVLVVSLIFAFSHSIIQLAWWHVFIFFPALVFAWLKQRTRTIWASVFFHAACNVFGYWVIGHYFS